MWFASRMAVTATPYSAAMPAQRLPLHDHVDSRWGDRCARRRGGRGRRGGRPRRTGTPRAGRRRGRGSRGWSSGRRRPARCGTATGVSDPVGDRRGCQIRHGGETRERNQDRDGAYREPRSPGRSGPWSAGIAGLAEGARSGGTARRAGSSARCPRAPRDDRRGHGRRRGLPSGRNRRAIPVAVGERRRETERRLVPEVDWARPVGGVAAVGDAREREPRHAIVGQPEQGAAGRLGGAAPRRSAHRARRECGGHRFGQVSHRGHWMDAAEQGTGLLAPRRREAPSADR